MKEAEEAKNMLEAHRRKPRERENTVTVTVTVSYHGGKSNEAEELVKIRTPKFVQMNHEGHKRDREEEPLDYQGSEEAPDGFGPENPDGGHATKRQAIDATGILTV